MRRFTFKEKRNSSYAIQKKHQILPKEKNLTITVRRRRTTYACFPMKQRKVVVVNLKTWQHNYDLFSLVMGRLENEGTLSPIVRRHFLYGGEPILISRARCAHRASEFLGWFLDGKAVALRVQQTLYMHRPTRTVLAKYPSRTSVPSHG